MTVLRPALSPAARRSPAAQPLRPQALHGRSDYQQLLDGDAARELSSGEHARKAWEHFVGMQQAVVSEALAGCGRCAAAVRDALMAPLAAHPPPEPPREPQHPPQMAPSSGSPTASRPQTPSSPQSPPQLGQSASSTWVAPSPSQQAPEKKKGPATQESKREGPSKTELNKMAKKAAKEKAKAAERAAKGGGARIQR